MSPQIDQQDIFTFNKATGALNIVIAEQGPQAIQLTRTLDDTEIVSILALGARSNNKNVRSNTTVLLANIVDNNSVCVVIDNLYDDTFKDTADWVNGRANLLAIVSAMIPWAYKDNFENVRKVLEYTRENVSATDPNLQKTRELMERIEVRMDLQNTYGADANKLAPLPENLRDCVTYSAKWAGERLKYSVP